VRPAPVGMQITVPSSVIIDSKKFSLIAFCYAERETELDKKYNAAFLASSFSCPVRLTINGEHGRFNCAVAAYQAIKWWDRIDTDGKAIRPKFEACVRACDALRLRCRLAGYHDIGGEVPDWDRDFMGLQRQSAMLAVAAAKFSSHRLKMALLATESAYLLEHSRGTNSESYWSDNYDGSGHNHTGKLLMKLRHRLGGAGNPAPEVCVANFTRQLAC